MWPMTPPRDLEAHLLSSSPLIAELCLLPSEGRDPWDGCRAVVVPCAETLSEQWVFMARQRMEELLTVGSVLAPRPVRVEDVVLFREPLPRKDGDVDRGRVAELVERSARARSALLGPRTDGVAQLLARLREELELSGPFSPASRLEADLGIDSLKLIQLRALLAEEFEVTVPDREWWSLHTLDDLVRRVASARWSGDARDYGWPQLLRSEVDAEPLDVRFNLTRRGIHWWAAQFGMYAFRATAKLAFKAHLVHPERLPRRGPYLLCPTHQSRIDSLLIYALFPYATVHRFMTLAYGPYFRGGLGVLVRMGRVILTGEANTMSDSLKLAFQGLQRDYVVTVFPEGSCSPSGEIMPAKPGVGVLACEAQVPIVPMVFQGSHRLLSPKSPGVKLTPIRAVIGDPIPPPAPRRFERVDYQGLANEWREAVLRLQADHPWEYE